MMRLSALAMLKISMGRLGILGGLIFLAGGSLFAQDTPLDELFPGLMDRAVIMDFAARIVEQNQEIVWDTENSRVTIPGRPVGIKLLGSNVAVSVQFTPYFRPNNRHILVAQGQIWISIPGKGVSYHTIMQAIPLEFDEEILFFPLGSDSSQNSDSTIEIKLVLRPYSSEAVPVPEEQQLPQETPPEPSSPSIEESTVPR